MNLPQVKQQVHSSMMHVGHIGQAEYPSFKDQVRDVPLAVAAVALSDSNQATSETGSQSERKANSSTEKTRITQRSLPWIFGILTIVAVTVVAVVSIVRFTDGSKETNGSLSPPTPASSPTMVPTIGQDYNMTSSQVLILEEYADLLEAVDLYYGVEPQHELILDRFGRIEDWNVSRITNMERLFDGIDRNPALRTVAPDLSTWDVSQVTNMNFMFQGSVELTPISAPGA